MIFVYGYLSLKVCVYEDCFRKVYGYVRCEMRYYSPKVYGHEIPDVSCKM